ncbi:hypothetical protein conserved [Leishmania donovani]|uniref:Uncharacterized protein n=3 Tax=Leishmania donovani species complex TaxID=38574 RepID=A4HUT2_LEIIN|nr:conserved hypothetical protein [Leishmania infantum JPCM5]XP_003858998.1 hypothetical protein, conserved [Leishmania donovani]CAC9459844.1 hypothetical_protein_-_conserved [Leishmania infantum]AYU76789.1 hypothetical protein LdCL_110006900 [Leishmania donovani]TPP39807.1 hypothetical protein CGC20_30680 [Leishmania donovani]TPP53069.1 hypothetical protein CGC21_1105 [Leishmania donovani]CAJ1986845.1 hypothetical protein conserved [Leishmania donovani]|eukprot:XP_001463823.1 conserved hypothetical protein [Leishmania infantum JPCM5]
MSNKTMASAAGSSATSPLPVMPPALRQLIIAVERLNAASTSPSDVDTVSSLGRSARELPEQSTSDPPADNTVAPTVELLRQVDALQEHYRRLLELAEQPYSTQNAAHAESPSDGSSDTVEAQAESLMTEFEAAIVQLQRGIRSKQAQAIRLVLLNALRREAAERRQCVAKMEGVLSASHQYVRL